MKLKHFLNIPAVFALGLAAAVALTLVGLPITADAATISGIAFIGATLAQNGKITLLDMAKSMDPDGKTAEVVELLNQTNEILRDMTWAEGNLPTGNRTTVRTGLPTSVWRKLYGGVPASKSIRAQVDDACGMLEARSEVDKDIAELNGNTAAFRLQEAQAFLESMNQEMARALFYESQATNPERITGLSPRYSSLSAGNAQNIISAGGAGADNTSVWLVLWGPNTVHGIVPKGSKAGIQHENLGLIDAFDANNNRYRAYADHWQWKCGLSLRDWRYVVRICNIDVSDLTGLAGTQAVAASTFLLKLMIKAMARIPAMGMGRAVFYANRTVKEMLSILALEKTGGAGLKLVEATNQFGAVSPGSAGGADLSFFGVPVRTVDQLTSAEAVVS